MPEELAYWIIKLRRWQKKYNFQSHPMPWIELPNSNLNEKQLREKGSNFFLFRDYGLSYPRSFQARIASRLAASLFYSCASERLATYNGRFYDELRRDNISLSSISNLNKFESKFTAHSTRASLITAYIDEFRIPIEVIQKLVGHSSILMTAYYVKSDAILGKLRERMSDGHKLAMQNEVETLQAHIESQRIEELKGQLTASDLSTMNQLDKAASSGGLLFKDIGICPVAGQKCDSGGESKSSLRAPVRQGFLGEQNCISCRYFVTGPAFLPALIALANEISYKVKGHSKKQAAMAKTESQISSEIEALEDQIYRAYREAEESVTLEKERNRLKTSLNTVRGNLETVGKKIDMWLTDINYIFKLTSLCKELLSKQHHASSKSMQLLATDDVELSLEFEDVDDFEQLVEVCNNADIYSSCDATEATYEQSQKIDRMLQHNGIEPRLFALTEMEQRQLSRQIVELLNIRLKSWNELIGLINLNVNLQDIDTTLKLRGELQQKLEGQQMITSFKSTEL